MHQETHLQSILGIIMVTSNKKLLGAPGLTAKSKDATRVSWHRYYEQEDATNETRARSP